MPPKMRKRWIHQSSEALRTARSPGVVHDEGATDDEVMEVDSGSSIMREISLEFISCFVVYYIRFESDATATSATIPATSNWFDHSILSVFIIRIAFWQGPRVRIFSSCSRHFSVRSFC